MHTDILEFLNDYSESTNNIKQIRIDSPELTQLHKVYNNFYRKLGKYNNELKEDLKVLKPLNFYLQISCYDYSDVIQEKLNEETKEKVNEFLGTLTYLDDPTINHLINLFINLIKNFSEDKVKNLISENVEKLIDDYKGKTIAIVSYEDVKKKYFSSEVEVYQPNIFLKTNKIFDVVIFVGTPSLYPEFQTLLFGKKIYYISHNNFNAKFKTEQILSSDLNSISNLYEGVTFNGETKMNVDEQVEYLDNESLEIEKEIRLNNIVEKYSNNKVSEMNDNISGYLIPFTNGKVFISPENAKLHVLSVENSIDDAKDFKVLKKPSEKLKVNDWIIIKNYTTATYLAKVAKNIIGESSYDECMTYINNYKSELVSKMNEIGNVKSLYRDMKKHGIKISTVLLLKNWLFGDTIKPRELEKILNYLSFSDYLVNKTINAADKIIQAHITAGREVIKELNKKIEVIDNEEIMEEMSVNEEYVFDLEGVGEFLIQQVQYTPQKVDNISSKDMYKLIGR
ncbi:Uncharacterised protein [Staphylococcus piscifermentans]|uniref:DISARM protein DrmE C-terminal domain-containing protein n=3 Tax=Staphylococcus piscifermentans TaxID=70258 RepID=A0A239TH97_9STAP|nr:hypothetical protein [Staphylococcus piscifermentans]GEP85350.1 hypothetical protein SPI02_19350 [Staphylococcus piscifermentans]SNU97016.1 Uncharacterised protein [Staphylococcus piscifermentans]